jgi:hypothetical protein
MVRLFRNAQKCSKFLDRRPNVPQSRRRAGAGLLWTDDGAMATHREHPTAHSRRHLDRRHPLAAKSTICTADLLREFWRPPQQQTGFTGVADKYRRVTRTPITHLCRHRSSGHFFACFHHLGNRKAAPVPEIERNARLTRRQPIDGHSHARSRGCRCRPA